MNRIPNLASERGAVLIQTAAAALVLVGFGTFVVDYGVLWVARNQAQNAADAGAVAGVIARAYDDFDDPPNPDGLAYGSVSKVVGQNLVWGASLVPTAGQVTSFGCPPEAGAPLRCVRVDVYRNGEEGSTALPTWFAPALGITSQGVKATASAQVLIGNGTNCLRPLAIPDKWTESSPTPPVTFAKYDSGGHLLPPPRDDYDPPSTSGPGTGLQFPTSNSDPEDLGSQIPFTYYADSTIATNPVYPGQFVPLALTGGYDASVAACNGQTVSVGDQIAISGTPNPTDFTALFDADSGASWDAGTRTIDGSCAPGCAHVSPRLIAIAVFDVDIFQYRLVQSNWTACPPGRPSCTPCPGGNPCVSIVNIVGYFIADAAGSTGYLTSYPGLIPTDAPKLTAQSSFLKAITLVR
jgi:hypothetical protein